MVRISGAGAELALGLVFVLVAAAPADAARPTAHPPTPDKRELQAREDFGAGRYEKALDGFAKLYGEKLHPNYLRNIGRCYQNMGKATEAITQFREYLRKAKNVSAEERAEINGYIKEMEALQAKQPPSAPAALPPTTTPQPAPAPAPAPVPAPSASPGLTSLSAQAPPSVSDAASSSPVYSRWWFWTAIGTAVVGGTVAVLASGALGRKTSDPPCPASVGRGCS